MNWPFVLAATTSGLIGMALSWALSARFRPRTGAALTGLLVLAIIGLVIAGRRATGFDGMAHMIIAVFYVAPAALGAAFGAAIAWWRGRRAA